MTTAEIHDAVWAARLLAEGKVVLLSDKQVLQICQALVYVNDHATMVPPSPPLFTDGVKVTP